MGKISGYPQVGSMGSGDYFLIDTTPITSNSTSIITKANAFSSIMTNPMTTLGDLVYENATPAPARLAGNTTSTKKFLAQTGTGSVSAAPVWSTIVAGDVPTLNQSTTGNAATATAALGLKSATTTVAVSAATAPSNGQVLTASNSTTAAWVNPSSGFANPMTTTGDTIYGSSGGAATRLAVGTTGQVLTVASGIPSWATPSAATATFFDVKTYGAVGNGAADDTTAIQAAITAALASPEGTGTVYFPAGTYKITGSLNCTSATGSASGYGVILRGDGHRASTIFKNSSFGPAVTFNGNGGPDGNNTQFGGMIDISIEGNATTGGLLQTNSAQQMFFRGCSFSGSNSWAWDLHTMQDSYFSQCSFNTNGSTSDYVIKIYGDVNGTSNMLWFNQIRVEDFLLGGINIIRGAGATGGGNNGFFFSQCKIENAGRVHGDLFNADGYTQQLVMDQIFLSAGGFAGGFSTPVNGITFGDGSTGSGDNQATFTNIFMNSGTGVAASTINIKGASGMTGPVTVDNVFLDNTPTVALLNINGASNLNVIISNLNGPTTLIAGDGSQATGSIVGNSTGNPALLATNLWAAGASDFVPVFNAFAPNSATGTHSQFRIGTAAANFNSAEFNYNYVGGSGSTSNSFQMSMFGYGGSTGIIEYDGLANIKFHGTGAITLDDAKNIAVNATTGTKIGTATTQKLGFWNVTPVAQPQTTGTTTGFTASTGTTVVSGSTFTGSSGSTAYTIGDIVLALKQAGIMKA